MTTRTRTPAGDRPPPGAGASLRRALTPTALTTLGSSGLAVAINLATDTPTTTWPWVAVAGLTGLMFVFSLWQQHRADPDPTTGEPRTEPPATQDPGPVPEHPTPPVSDGATQAAARPPSGQHIERSFVLGSVYQVGGGVGTLTAPAPTPPDPRRRLLRIVAALVAAAVLVAITVIGARVTRTTDTPTPAPGGAPASTMAPADVTMHEVWPSSRANRRLSVPRNDWVATDFSVTQPYIRSVEVGAMYDAGGQTQTVLLRVLDSDGTEIASGEATISDYRAKYVFTHPIDVRDHLGQHLYLQLLNTTDRPLSVYMSTDDTDPTVTSYIACGHTAIARCPNPDSQDLSALIIGRNSPTPW